MAIFRDSIRINTKGFKEAIGGLESIPDHLIPALEKTVRKTTEFLKEEIPRVLIARYAISEPSLRDQSHRARWSMKAEYTREEGSIVDGRILVQGTRMPVMRFDVHPRYVPVQKGIPVKDRQQVTVTVRRGSSQVGAPNVFIAKMKSGHIGVFRRKPDATHRRRPDGQRTQLNITEEYMLSVPEMLRGKQLSKKLQNNTTKFFNKTALEEIERVLNNSTKGPIAGEQVA
jgi:hypothetical protein